MVRAPMAVLSVSRDSARMKGAWGVNEMTEQLPSGVRAVKRPGLINTLPALSSTGQGLFNWNFKGVAVVTDGLMFFDPKHLYPVIGPGFGNSGVSGPAWDSSATYQDGDLVDVTSSDPNFDGPWYSVGSSHNVAPGPTSTAFPHWSRYKKPKLAGTSISFSGVTVDASGILTDGYIAVGGASAYVTILSNGVPIGGISGSANTSHGGRGPYSFNQNYSNYPNGTAIINGYASEQGSYTVADYYAFYRAADYYRAYPQS